MLNKKQTDDSLLCLLAYPYLPRREFQLEKQQMRASHQMQILQQCSCQLQLFPCFENDIRLHPSRKNVASGNHQAYMMMAHEPVNSGTNKYSSKINGNNEKKKLIQQSILMILL